jgi:hypothetical protein
LIDQLFVDCHGVFHFLPPMAIYTVLFTPSKGHTVPICQYHHDFFQQYIAPLEIAN